MLITSLAKPGGSDKGRKGFAAHSDRSYAGEASEQRKILCLAFLNLALRSSQIHQDRGGSKLSRLQKALDRILKKNNVVLGYNHNKKLLLKPKILRNSASDPNSAGAQIKPPLTSTRWYTAASVTLVQLGDPSLACRESLAQGTYHVVARQQLL